MPPTSASARSAHWLWPPLLLLGSVTALIAWLLIALALGNQAGWMAVLVALEVVWMLRLGTLRAGRLRIGVAVATTALIIVGANWGIASAQLGGSLGLDPWTSAQKMGPRLAWTLLQLANNAFDLLCYFAAVVVAWWAAR
ncbi:MULTISPECIES: hypothetical protein [Xanthomonas]|uniref:hypothetical protein n=1 Tax=Xanthomonas TaxID=338 RepID=UPI0006FF03F6|nr:MULTISPECIES: hypothetical protein [Xanthomonas]KQR11585.1 hypothetical protein ASF90_13530 [Xanthomonas sp. Leaf148]MEA9564232.1 hypothetical protein [Xanthomonas sp. WHRI 8932A]MEA9579165.1 hypothetical protein [Xanthomonas nasturtii]MEA9589037.1 hypothetical protein [Xanthomonas sp. WHRI 10064B]MEA9614022.1 hypothetical protein [Xanthomonas sp. WHRI 10064A]